MTQVFFLFYSALGINFITRECQVELLTYYISQAPYLCVIFPFCSGVRKIVESLVSMDFPQLQSVCDPQSDLKSLGENLNQRSVSLPFSKYEKVACWVKQKQSVENPEFLNNDDLGKILIPDDIIFREGSKFIACRATRYGHCLFNSASRILVGNESLKYFLRLLITRALR